MPTAPPCAVVIFGASGDLAKRKLIPALYEMAREKLLNEHTYIVGFSRSPMTDDEYRKESREAVTKYARTKPVDEGVLKSVIDRLHYFQGDYGDAGSHQKLAEVQAQLDEKYRNHEKNRLFYLSTPPNTFEPIISRVGERALDPKTNPEARWKRLIIEKPFGYDLASAQALN